MLRAVRVQTIEKVASLGLAGVLSIAVAETVFWVLSFPASELLYFASTGEWIDLLSQEGQIKFLAFSVSAAVPMLPCARRCRCSSRARRAAAPRTAPSPPTVPRPHHLRRRAGALSAAPSRSIAPC